MADTVRSRLPNVPDLDQDLAQFLDAVDRRQLRMANVTNLDGAATLADVITKLNELLETHRTR